MHRSARIFVIDFDKFVREPHVDLIANVLEGD